MHIVPDGNIVPTWLPVIVQSAASPSAWPAGIRTPCVSSTTSTDMPRSASWSACCGDRAAAEDVQQQVFLEAWQRAERYDPERGGLLGWLLTIARSRAIDHLRRRVPEPRDPSSAVALADRADDGRADELLEQWRLAARSASCRPGRRTS